MATGEAGLGSLDGLVLVAHDFDKTIAMTSAPLEGGYTVEEAYESAVKSVLGQPALDVYKVTGGLRNRAPSDVVDQLAGFLDATVRRQYTEDLVAAKLDRLTPQIGKRMVDGSIWPPLNAGFVDYWRPVSAMPEVSTGIVSSGHEPFIRRTFQVHDEQPPDVFVTDDDMRAVMNTVPRQVCEKPSRLLIDTLTGHWLNFIGYIGAGTISLEKFEKIVTEQVVYTGDDLSKDGKLAANAKVPFVHITQSHPALDFAELRSLVTNKTLVGSDVT